MDHAVVGALLPDDDRIKHESNGGQLGAGKLDGYAVLAAGLAWHDQPGPVLLFCFGSPCREQAAAAPWPLPARTTPQEGIWLAGIFVVFPPLAVRACRRAA